MTRKIIQEIIFIAIRVALIAALVFIAYGCISKCYDFGYRIFADEAKDPKPGIVKTVAIVDGKSDKEIGEVLEEKGLIDDSFLFMLQVKFSDYNKQLKPGVYELSTGMTPDEMMAVMSAVDEEEEGSEESEEYTPSKNEATLWDEADDTAKDSDKSE